MAVTGKPQRDNKTEAAKKPAPAKKPAADEAKIMRFIESGGSVPGENSGHQESKFTLRVRSSLVNQMDEAVDKHPVYKSRNTWIVNAIVEQLKREGLS